MDRRRRGRKAALPLVAVLLGWLANGPALACKLAILGDSLTAGFGLVREEAFPARLEQALRARGITCAVLDAGVSGDTSAGGAARIDWVLADRPTHLLVELGGNDALRALPPAALEANLDRIVRTAKEHGVQVMLAGMLAPPNLGSDYGKAFEAVYLELARRHHVPLYPFFLDGVVLQRDLMQPDGIHPNGRGVDVIVARIVPMIESFLQGK
ncbi:arylesterase [Benzoatithermus flavus]|uniref:Arylesterase n=1 Tax=Benzoatithermus flavus TaxID=3108223 RepID=A0ABU8XW92_9PROT